MTIFTLDPHSVFASTDENGAKRQVDMAEVETLFTEVITAIDAIGSTPPRLFASKSALDGNLQYDANTSALVIGDPTVAYNGLYRKNGASGTGSWTRVADLPGYSFIKATNSNGPNPNDILATTAIPIPAGDGAALIAVPILTTNNSSPVTLTFNGDGNTRPIKTSGGTNVGIGGLVAGRTVLGMISGGAFQLLSDQATAGIQAAAEAAQAAAEEARDEAVAAAAIVKEDMELWGWWGQSNGQGIAPAASSIAIQAGMGWQYYSGALTNKTADPIGPATDGGSGPGFMMTRIALTGKKVCVVNACVGGTSVNALATPGNGTTNWSSTGTLRASYIAQLTAAMQAIDAAGYNPVFKGHLMFLGEADATAILAGTSGCAKAAFKTGIQGVWDYLWSTAIDGTVYADAPIIVATTGCNDTGDDTGKLQVREAQWELTRANRYRAWVGYDGAQEFCIRVPSYMQSSSAHYTNNGYDEQGICLGRSSVTGKTEWFDRTFDYALGGTLITKVDGVSYQSYRRLGPRTLQANWQYTMGASDTISGGQGTFALPIAVASETGLYFHGSVSLQDISAALFYGGNIAAFAGGRLCPIWDGSGHASWRAASPVTWAAGDIMRGSVIYDINVGKA